MEVPPLTLELSPSSSAAGALAEETVHLRHTLIRMRLHTLSGVRCRQIATSYRG
ncbi:hypothetical protein PILCRDRAFT_827548 [Piloderma croceum F 1598]|uniref:Uncharacterized protein n=1 Tax=Piloderma croceum (strain F 1598) TaxID=765440 RepID=A0A0C3F559_PILCF|nr:hypothetical protein PILCRDRAFT_827548 [Piloderma croceum F 1598]